VIVVADGPAALHAMTEHEDAVDVVLTDVIMPGMSGIDLARRLRSERPALPLVYFSGHHGDVQRPDDGPLIHKPFTPEELVTSIADVLPARLLAGR
jgi:CheY-like chemotaxis protein